MKSYLFFETFRYDTFYSPLKGNKLLNSYILLSLNISEIFNDYNYLNKTSITTFELGYIGRKWEEKLVMESTSSQLLPTHESIIFYNCTYFTFSTSKSCGK